MSPDGGTFSPAPDAVHQVDLEDPEISPQTDPTASPSGEAPSDVSVDPFEPDFTVFPEEERHIHQEWFEKTKKEMQANFMRGYNKKFQEAADARKKAEEMEQRLSPYLPALETIEKHPDLYERVHQVTRDYFGGPQGQPSSDPLSEGKSPGILDPDVEEALGSFIEHYAKQAGFVRRGDIDSRLEPLEKFTYGSVRKAERSELRESLLSQGLHEVFDSLNSPDADGKSRLQREMDRHASAGNEISLSDAFWIVAGKEGHLQQAAAAGASRMAAEKRDAQMPGADQPATRESPSEISRDMSLEEMEQKLPWANPRDSV